MPTVLPALPPGVTYDITPEGRGQMGLPPPDRIRATGQQIIFFHPHTQNWWIMADWSKLAGRPMGGDSIPLAERPDGRHTTTVITEPSRRRELSGCV